MFSWWSWPPLLEVKPPPNLEQAPFPAQGLRLPADHHSESWRLFGEALHPFVGKPQNVLCFQPVRFSLRLCDEHWRSRNCCNGTNLSYWWTKLHPLTWLTWDKPGNSLVSSCTKEREPGWPSDADTVGNVLGRVFQGWLCSLLYGLWAFTWSTFTLLMK